MDDKIIWRLIDSYFRDNPQSLVAHHIDSYNDFMKNGIFQIFKEKNPVRIHSNYDKDIDDFRNQALLYFGGKDGTRIKFGKPVIYDDDNSHYMFPNEARLRNMTYGMTVHYDIEVEFIDILANDELPKIVSNTIEMNDDEFEDIIKGGAPTDRKKRGKRKTGKLSPEQTAQLRELVEQSMITPNTQLQTFVIENIYLCRIPIMLQSNYCILSGLSREIKYNMGECKNDVGGYFIIDGKEKTVIPQEKFADNMLYITHTNNDEFLYSANIRSVSENLSKPVRTLSVNIVAPSKSYANRNIVVNIPNVRSPVPLFILFRALGIISDKAIIEMCLLDLDKYDSLIDEFIPSVYDAGGIMTQTDAIQYIGLLTKGKTAIHAHEILADYFLPHIGEVKPLQKAYYLGHIVFRLLCVARGLDEETNRDNFKFKRIDTIGVLMTELFREYYSIQQNYIRTEYDKRLNLNYAEYGNNLYNLIVLNYKEIFRDHIVDDGIRRAFKGNWGAKTHTKRIGVVQDLNRLSFNSALSHLRKTNLAIPAGVKLVGPRVLHNTQWGYFDPIDTPDGGNIGLHKHLSIMAHITGSISREPIITWLYERIGMRALEDFRPIDIANTTKVFVNGYWAGIITDPNAAIEKIKLFRRNALIPIYVSVSFDKRKNIIYIYTDAGRMTRPILYRDNSTGRMSYENAKIMGLIEDGKFTWEELVTGFNKKRTETMYELNNSRIYDLYELYNDVDNETNPAKLARFITDKSLLEYIDISETEDALIALNPETIQTTSLKYTHQEIHESLIFGMMCNMINYLENNPGTRNSFSCGQSKQAVSLYHTNYQYRMDKTAVVLSYGQTPLVKTRYLEYITHDENTYGENAIVAIMCFTGYNVEDAVLINEGSLKRGLFRTTYYSTYELHEEVSQTGDAKIENIFTNIESVNEQITRTKPGYDYSKLDHYGMILENTPVDEKTVLVGMTTRITNGTNITIVDASKTPKKGQIGIVDKSFITSGEEGKRIAKVRIREERIPALGDKMASRAGQKGTVGLIIPEADMPFTKDGLRPDMIINPHALPSRMTVGHLVECLVGKAAAQLGGFGDCTAFENRGSKVGIFGEVLSKSGFHSSGNEIMYNGMTGEQFEADVFIGPTYYMRLKHMVKDKINYRARGPRTALTKQPVSGRANDGGLRIGEMERDALISHGAVNFLTESMMERGDKYYMAICNNSGMLAIYNPSNDVMMSPMADGPIQFSESFEEKNNINIVHITKYGRNFSIVQIPYSLKLLSQELLAMNISLRIITDDNINQIENMTFSNTIQKTTGITNITPEQIIEQIRNQLKTRELPVMPAFTGIEENPLQPSVMGNIEQTVIGMTPTTTPPSPEYAPGTPAYMGSNTESPAYAMGTPAYMESPSVASPDYAPGSPAYAVAETSETQPEYTVGQQVLIQGKGPTIYKITRIGNKFITVENSNIENSIEVVDKNYIYPYDPAMFQPIVSSTISPNPVNIEPAGNQTPYINNATPLMPAFSPVFNIVTGNDNKITGEPIATNTTMQTSESYNTPDVREPITNTKTESKDNNEKEPSKGGNNSMLDLLNPMKLFSTPLLIKKEE